MTRFYKTSTLFSLLLFVTCLTSSCYKNQLTIAQSGLKNQFYQKQWEKLEPVFSLVRGLPAIDIEQEIKFYEEFPMKVLEAMTNIGHKSDLLEIIPELNRLTKLSTVTLTDIFEGLVNLNLDIRGKDLLKKVGVENVDPALRNFSKSMVDLYKVYKQEAQRKK